MNTLFQMTMNEDGEPYPYGNDWHVGGASNEGSSLACTGEYFDAQGSYDVEGFAKCITKEVPRGGITCSRCLDVVRSFKDVKL